MKNAIIYLLALVAISSCNNSKRTSTDPFKNISWVSENLSRYQLVRPIDIDEGALDAYAMPIREGQWYLINKNTQCYLLPVYTDGGTGPGLVENVTKWKKVAILDTVQSVLMHNMSSFDGLYSINKIEIVCFKKGYSVHPTTMPTGAMTVMIKKE